MAHVLHLAIESVGKLHPCFIFILSIICIIYKYNYTTITYFCFGLSVYQYIDRFTHIELYEHCRMYIQAMAILRSHLQALVHFIQIRVPFPLGAVRLV